MSDNSAGKGMFERMAGAFKGSAQAQAQDKGQWNPIVPVPEDAPSPPAAHWKLGPHTAEYGYRSAAGEILGYIRRYDTGDGAKEFWPLTFCEGTKTGRREWRWKSFDAPRPLYGIDRLAVDEDARVILCEGEKSADAVARLLPGVVGMSSPGGSNAAGKADWGPLAGRTVVVWPDADDAGGKYAKAVVEALQAARAASVAVIAPPSGVKVGWDAADALDEGWDMARAQQLVSQARAAQEVLPVEGNGVRQRQKEHVLETIRGVQLWHDPGKRAFCTLPINAHHENWPVNSKTFERWLTGLHHAGHGGALGGQTLKDCILLTEAQAIFDGPEQETFFRVGQAAGAVYIDLGGPDWRAVKVTPDGWEMVDQAPVKFLRSPHIRALPEPEAGGSIDQLRNLVNYGSEANFHLINAWLVGSFNPAGPYPLLVVGGEQGTAKSTLTRALRSLVDPNATLIRTAPRDERDLFVAASNNWVLSFDNLSSVPAWLSDGLCRISTGGGFASRKLYSDLEEEVFEGQRPVILNGIGDLAARPDLADRAIAITLPPIPDDKRFSEKEWIVAFNAAAPEIFGAILDGVSAALRHVDQVQLPCKPRMADFAAWVTAAEPGLGWPEGSFLPLYAANRDEAAQSSLEADPLAQAVLKLLDGRFHWEGPASELLSELTALVPQKINQAKWWPSTPAALSRQLDRAKPILRIQGIEITRHKGGANSSRSIVITRVPSNPAPSDDR